MKNYAFAIIMILSASINAQISNDGLLAYYPFDGDATDHGPNNYDGIMNGGNFGEDSEGNPNAALYLNGTNEFVDLSVLADSFRMNLGQMTLFFNIYFEDHENQQTILSLGNDGEDLWTNVFEVEYEQDRFQIETETGISAINHELVLDQAGSLFTNNWHQILITLNGDSLSYCRDGELIYHGTYTPSETLTNNLFLGNFGGAIQGACCFFGGAIDDLQIYNRILDKEELTVNTSSLNHVKNPWFFPNPTHQKISVILEKQYPSISVILTDTHGKTILKRQIDDVEHFDLDIPYPKGLYFLQVFEQNENIGTFKILKL